MCFSSGVYLYFRILMYVTNKQFEIGYDAILKGKKMQLFRGKHLIELL